MSLSKILKNYIARKLQIKKLNKKLIYSKELLNKAFVLTKNIEENFLKKNKFYEVESNININENRFYVSYIISIFFSKSNTIIQLSDVKGKTKIFYTAGKVNLSGKQKKKRKLAILKLMSLLIKETSFVNNEPVALHLNNVFFQKSLIIKKLKEKFFIQIIKTFNLVPYNGCRKKKIRRKKNKK